MRRVRRAGRINVKVLVILVGVVVLLGAGAVSARQIRKRVIADRGLAAGNVAFESGEWAVACKHLKRYLERYPNERPDILEKYAQAHLNVRPTKPENIGAAIGAYRRLLRLDPSRGPTYEALAQLYGRIRSFNELMYVARKRLERDPEDPQAPLWMAASLLAQRKSDEARQELESLVTRLEQRDGKYSEYVDACGMLSNIAAQEDPPTGGSKALGWLSKAVAYNPQSPTALVQRARFYRLSAAVGAEEQDQYVASALQDLEAADSLEPQDPAVRLALCQEWTEHGEFRRALAELQAVEAGDEATLRQSYPVRDDWLTARFRHEAEVLLRERSAQEGAALADEILAHLEHWQHRVHVLPLAVKLYLTDNRTADARRCLEEYRDGLVVGTASAESNETIAVLGALLAWAEEKPYRVIELLEPYLDRKPSDTAALRLLASAYSRTGQDRRAARALEQYRAYGGRPEDPEVVLGLAREHLKAGQWAQASQLAAMLSQDNVAAALVRIEARLAGALERPPGESEEALQALAADLAQLRESHPKRVDIRVLEASVVGLLGRTEAAEEMLRAAINDCADPLPAEMALARFYTRTQRIDEALDVCRAACDRHSSVAEPWGTLAGVLTSAERYSEARDALLAGLEAVDGRAARYDLEFSLTQFDLLRGARPDAIERLRMLAAGDPTDVRSRSALLDLPEILEDAESAERLVDELREIQGDTGLLWRLHGAALWMSGEDWKSREQEIREALEYCVAADPGWSAPVLLLGQLHTRLGRLDEAERVYEGALAANPDAADVADRLLGLLQDQKRFGDAHRVLERLERHIRIRPERRIEILARAGDLDRAIEELRGRIASDANDVESRIRLAQLIYRRTGDTDAALQYLDDAEAIAGGSLAITGVRAAILRSEGRTEDLRRLLDAEAEKEQTFEAYYMRAAFLASVGETELAEKDYVHLTTFENPDGHVLLGVFYADAQRLEEAIGAWERGLVLYPENVGLKRALMMGLFARAQPNDRERGIQILAELEQQVPNDARLLWVRAMLRLEDVTPEARQEAEQLLDRATELEPTLVDAHLGLIDIARRRGDLGAARLAAIRALNSNPNVPSLLLKHAEIEAALDNVVMARTLVRQALRVNSQDRNALHLLAQLALKNATAEMLEEAQRLLQDALEQKPADMQLQIDFANVLDAGGESERAVAVLEEFRNRAQPDESVVVLLALADLHQKRYEPDLADACLAEAELLGPEEPMVLLMRIDWLGKQKRFDQIVELMRDNRPDPPYTAQVLFAAGVFLASSGVPAHEDVGLDLFETALARLPTKSELETDVALRLNIATMMYKTGAIDKAEQVYRDVLATHPQNAGALNDLAWILAEARHAYEEALPLADRGLQVAPRSTHLLDTRGVILSHLPGRLRDARRDFERCVELSQSGTPARAKALLQLGRTCARLDDETGVRRCLQEALEIDRKQDVFTTEEREEISGLTGQTDTG